MSYDRRPPSPDPQRLADRRAAGPLDYPYDEHYDSGRSSDGRGSYDEPGPYGGREPREPWESEHRDARDGREPRSGRPRDYSAYGPRVQRRVARRRAQQRRRRVLAVLILLMLVGTIGFLVLRSARESTSTTADGAAGPVASQGVPAAPEPSAVEPADVPQTGPGTFSYASGTGKVLGTAGTLRKFQVAVEKQVGQNAGTFAATVDRILGDNRGWIAAGKSKFQRVPSGASHEFVIYLATPATSEKMCAAGGLHTDKYASCRLPGQVIINLARWLAGVPGYGASLDVYQAYALNHEVGHQLGLYHEACPGPGQAASVMQQQTLGLQGCVANAWPYVGGVRVTGPPIP